MGFRHFHIAVVTRAILLAATCLLLVYVTAHLHLKITAVLVAALLAIQVWGLIHYVEKSNRDVSRFLTGIQQDDFSQSFPDDGRNGSHRELQRALNEVTAEFRRVRAEREESFRYLNTIVTHIETGLVAVAKDGQVELINPAARRLLGMESVRSIGDLKRRSEPLAAAIESLRPGERSLLRLESDGGATELSLAATEVRIGGRGLKLIAAYDIARELDARELEAWGQLSKVLSHEIANSITPIASLAATATDLLSNVETGRAAGDNYSVNAATFGDLTEVVGTISQRSQGLVRFIEAYRRLTHLPPPSFRIVRLSDLLTRVKQLLLARPDAGSIRIECSVDPAGLELSADSDLVEQALINIGINSIEALRDRDDGVIELCARLGERGRVMIQVSDNGPGISQTAAEKVFVPFFSTKAGGSGIGLSLARQIARLHGGDITVASSPGGRTVFTLRF